MGHLRLYELAARYHIKELCNMIVAKLSESLKIVKVDDIQYILELVRFVYSETLEYDRDNSRPLRRLVVRNVNSIRGEIEDHILSRHMLQEEGNFDVDLLGDMWDSDITMTIDPSQPNLETSARPTG
jgi:hypothetical protein